MVFKNNPKVLILSDMYPSAIDQISGIFIHHHVKALQNIGIDLTVISPVPWSPKLLWFRKKWQNYGMMPREELIDGIPVKRPRYLALPSKYFRAVAGAFMFYGAIRTIKCLYESFKFDIIHAHTITPDGHAALFLKRAFKVPVICSIRGSDLKQYPRYSEAVYKASRRVLEESDAIITVSRDLANEATGMARVLISPYVIYNGVDTTKFRRAEDKEKIRESLGLPLHSRIISFVGRCVSDKGIFELFESFLGIEKTFKDVCLLIVGEGEDRLTIEKRVEECGLAGKVIFKGMVSHDKIPLYLNASDIFALPTYSEGMANVIYEAMACGLPVVATCVGGIPEVVSHEGEGLLCRPRNSKDLEECLVRLVNDQGLSEEMGRRGRDKMRERFSWEGNARANLQVYEEVLRGNEGRGIH